MTEEEKRNKQVGSLLGFLLQHMKCMESRLECAKMFTNRQEKYVLTTALNRVQSGINTIYSFLPPATVDKAKKALDRPDLVYMMVVMEELMMIPPDEIEEVVDLINKFRTEKYGEKEDQMPHNEQN